MKKIIKRYKYHKDKYKNLSFKLNKKIIKLKFSDIKKRFKVDSVINFLPYDSKFLKKRFYHFNLQFAGHKKNKRYLVLKIDRPGSYKDNVEKLPIYSQDKMVIYRCFYIKQNIIYEKINKKFLDYALIPTNNIAKLKKTILRRYKYLVYQHGKKLIIDAGVSITGLKLEKKISLKDLH